MSLHVLTLSNHSLGVGMQLVIWIITPRMVGKTAVATKNILGFIVFFQYLPRLFRIFPLTSQMVRNTGVLLETAWAGAAFNLLLYLLASHVSPLLFSHPFPEVDMSHKKSQKLYDGEIGTFRMTDSSSDSILPAGSRSMLVLAGS